MRCDAKASTMVSFRHLLLRPVEADTLENVSTALIEGPYPRATFTFVSVVVKSVRVAFPFIFQISKLAWWLVISLRSTRVPARSWGTQADA